MTHTASEYAAAVAGQAVTAQHGDNDPAATDALLVDKAVRDRAVPPVPDPAGDRAMCAAWSDHIRADPHPTPDDVAHGDVDRSLHTGGTDHGQ